MKKGRVIAAGGIVLVLTAGILMMGHLGGCRRDCFNGHGFRPGFCHRGPPLKCMGKDFRDFVLSRIDRCVEKLELSADQEEKYRDIRRKLAENLAQGQERKKKLLLEVRKEICREEPNMEAVAGIIKGGMEEMPSHMEKHLDLFVSFYNMLNEDQRNVLLKKFRERADCGEV
jgi:hypothetical protein